MFEGTCGPEEYRNIPKQHWIINAAHSVLESDEGKDRWIETGLRRDRNAVRVSVAILVWVWAEWREQVPSLSAQRWSCQQTPAPSQGCNFLTGSLPPQPSAWTENSLGLIGTGTANTLAHTLLSFSHSLPFSLPPFSNIAFSLPFSHRQKTHA